MYHYTPKSEKKLEKLIFAGLVVLAVLFFAGSQIPQIPYPVIFQTAAFALIAFAIIIVSKFLITDYSYSLEQDGGSQTELIVRERCGKRLRVVCRIPLSAVTGCTVTDRENRKKLLAERKSRLIYRYTGEMIPQDCLLLDVTYGGEEFCLLILSNSDFEAILKGSI